MESGYEALPPREGGRHKRRRPNATSAAPAPAPAPDAGEARDRAAASALMAAPYGGTVSAAEAWEYLDHTADVQIHSCACSAVARWVWVLHACVA